MAEIADQRSILTERQREQACSIVWIHRKVLEIAKEQQWPQPSYSRVYQIVRRLDPALVTLAHDGGKAYREEFDLLFYADPSLYEVIDTLRATHREQRASRQTDLDYREWLQCILDRLEKQTQPKERQNPTTRTQ